MFNNDVLLCLNTSYASESARR